ncbi:hypothetical protein HUJ04_008444 [Dendroctonus ponderosae]|nr:hypothetical protein HUJ04_008444 [Dendroctonus ponderosae]KAH1008340.1 hypothetical protein HUJ05_008900 [Dendroctonus ponderosae]
MSRLIERALHSSDGDRSSGGGEPYIQGDSKLASFLLRSPEDDLNIVETADEKIVLFLPPSIDRKTLKPK